MRRLFAITTSVLVLLALFAPAAFAAGPYGRDDSVLVSVNGTLDVPAGDHVDVVVTVSGTAQISGTIDTVVVVDGSATMNGANIGTLVVVDGTADLGPGTTVVDVRTMRGDVVSQEGSAIVGATRALDANAGAFAATVGLLLIPVMIVFAFGMAIVAVLAALALAAFGSKQVREVETLIERRPGHVLVAGLAGTILLPVAAFLLILTVIGAPIGFTLLFAVLPLLAFAGWLVAAIWVGEWLIGQSRGQREAGRPYRAAVLGVVVLGIAGILPFVSAIATLFGTGALLLAGWQTLRPEAPATPALTWGQPAPSAG
jgi:hypothetical protein